MIAEGVGVRRLTALIDGLSPRSALSRASEFEGRDWGVLEELLAQLIEEVDHSNRLYYGAHRQPSDRPTWEPIHVRRPWDKEEKQKPLTGKDLVEAFRGIVDENDESFVEYVPPPTSKGGEN